MSLFNYTLPSGAEFTVRGPAGATQADADRIFYEQVAAGALVGYEAGQTLTSVATQITKFELSRLDRGTAGVDTPTILAIVQGLPVVASIPNLSNVTLTNPIDEADIVSVRGDDLEPDLVGPLTPFQVQKLLAQIINLVDQPTEQISLEKGIGRYGFTAYALEQAGYVKPGTSLRFFSEDSEDFVSVMSSPSVWTGKNGVYSLNDLLNDVALQNQTQVLLMQQGYEQLEQVGVINERQLSTRPLSTGQVFTSEGLQPIQYLTSVSLFGGANRLLNSLLTSGAIPVAGTRRSSEFGSVNDLIALNSPIIGAVQKAITFPSVSLDTIRSGIVNGINLESVTQTGINITGIGAGINERINGEIGALVANASKFGSPATALWAKAGGLSFNNIDASSLLGGANRLLNTQLTRGAIPNINSITAPLTNLIPGNLTNLTSNLDVFGKASTFATNFVNPVEALNRLPTVGTLTAGLQGQLTGALTGLQGQLTGALTGLQGQLTGALTGALGNFSSIAGLFGGGGDLVSGTQVAGGFNNTVNRATLDAAFARIIGNGKVPLPVFQYPSLATLAPRLDIQQAQNFLRNLSGDSRNTFGQTVTV